MCKNIFQLLYVIIIFAQISNCATRIRRQTNCGFKCRKSGECINEDNKCDGTVDCKDGSDETFSTCSRLKCPSYLFKCKYGACINPDFECDGKPDCKDNSDESSPNCKNETPDQSGCGDEEFRCRNGECIVEDSKCDGVADCKDQSDESTATCSNMKCPGFTYRCAYGACVNGNSKCNGVKECHDGSDEAGCPTQPPITEAPPVITQAPPTAPPGTVPKGWCILPQHPNNGTWTIVADSFINLKPGDAVMSSTVLEIRCEKKYTALKSNVICYKGRWTDSVDQCYILCPPLTSTDTTKIVCTLKQILQDCNFPRSGTVAEVTCAPFHEDLQLLRYPKMICDRGKWDKPKPDCVPVCGKKSPNAKPLIVSGTNAAKGDYPWQVALFQTLKNGSTVFFCGGSLINQKVVLTAAHCVSNNKGVPLSKEKFVVAVGKYYSNFSDTRDTEAQFSPVKEVFVPKEFRGADHYYINDIAILVTTKTFELSWKVQPICVDWGLNFEEQLMEPEKEAIVTGWGLTTQFGKPSEVLKELKTPIVSHSFCVQQLPPNYESYLSVDKFCSGYLNQSTGVCSGDSGGALVSKNNYDGRYYVVGVVSVSPFDEGSCDVQQLALYTKISYHNAFIYEKERLYRPE